MYKSLIQTMILLAALLIGGGAASGYEYVGTITGASTGDQYGAAMCTVDFNADGIPDLVVSAPAADDAGTSSGTVCIYFGGSAADTLADLELIGAAGSFFGQAVASAGDFNNDDYEDLLVGAPFYDSPAENAGAVYLFFGGPSPDTAVDHIFPGSNAGDFYGAAVGGVGDFNNDSYDDIAVGAYHVDWGSFDNSGMVYVYYGGASPDYTADRILVGEVDGERFGYSLSGGDYNGDNESDIAVGAYSYNGTAINQGRVYLFHGGTSPDTVADMTIAGEFAGDKLGWSLASGRVSDDSYMDLIVGSSGFSVDTFATGKVYVYFGGPALDNISDYSYTLGRTAKDFLGDAIASAVDINGEGFDEFIVGMPGNDDGAIGAGGAILFSGGTSIQPDTVVLGNGQDEEMGQAVTMWQGYGNVNSYVFAVGAPSYDSFRGRVFLYLKAASGPNQPPVLNPIGSKNVNEGEELTFVVTSSDPDGSQPSLSTSILPENSSFFDLGNGTGSFVFNPDFTQAGTFNVTFYASDGEFIDSELVEISVNDINQSPVLNSIGSKNVKVGHDLTIAVTASDPDGQTPDLLALPLPPGAAFVNHHDGTGTFDWTPADADIGQHYVTFFASDGILADSEVVAITVADSASCCVGLTGNVDGDTQEMVDLGDLTALIDYLFISFTVPICLEEANVDGNPDGFVDLGDMTALIDYLFITFTPPAPCQ